MYCGHTTYNTQKYSFSFWGQVKISFWQVFFIKFVLYLPEWASGDLYIEHPQGAIQVFIPPPLPIQASKVQIWWKTLAWIWLSLAPGNRASAYVVSCPVCVLSQYSFLKKDLPYLFLDQVHVDLEQMESLEDAEQAIFFFNNAVLLHHLRQHHQAIRVLEKLFQVIEPLGELKAFFNNVFTLKKIWAACPYICYQCLW